MKNIIAFLFGWLIAAVILTPQAHAAVVARPSVSGYSAGKFSSAAGTFAMTAANDGFIAPATLNVGGKAITVPASLRMAQNAGQFAKNAMKLNPYALVGTLAAGWLLDQGFEYLNNQWQVPVIGGYQQVCTLDPQNVIGPCVAMGFASETQPNTLTQECAAMGGGAFSYNYQPGVGFDVGCLFPVGYVPVTRPATPDDWNALPDPLPVVAPELPYAPYMPDGVPVEAPEYDFAPFNVPLGYPYAKPDGSTAQPSAKVSPNGNDVTVDTYDQPLTDSNGQPVPNPTPQDTPEPTQSECEKHPGTIGCSEYGTPPAPDSLTTLTVPVTPDYSAIGGAGACPASVTVSGITWSYQPFCDFASAIRPLIIGFAWLSFAFIVAGTVRT